MQSAAWLMKCTSAHTNPAPSVLKFSKQYSRRQVALVGAGWQPAAQTHLLSQAARTHTVKTTGHVQSRGHPQGPSVAAHRYNGNTAPDHPYL
jgi:hypothetical protein